MNKNNVNQILPVLKRTSGSLLPPMFYETVGSRGHAEGYGNGGALRYSTGSSNGRGFSIVPARGVTFGFGGGKRKII
jgi:hypothetical protein